MLYKKLNKLYELKTKLYESLELAENSGADPEIISMRINDLECDIDKVNKEIEFEEKMRPFVYLIWIFALIGTFTVVLSIFNNYI
jgi:hypothetical protein